MAVPVLNNSILITCSTNKLSPICASRLFGSDEGEETFVNVPPHSLLQTPSSVENSRRQNVAPFVYADSIYYFYVSDKTSDGIFKQNFVPSEDGSIQFTELVNVQSPALLSKLPSTESLEYSAILTRFILKTPILEALMGIKIKSTSFSQSWTHRRTPMFYSRFVLGRHRGSKI